jgi:hypothetical protein
VRRTRVRRTAWIPPPVILDGVLTDVPDIHVRS